MDMYQKRKIRKEKRENSNQNEKFHKVVLNWYPGHMAKTKREIKERIDLVDVVVHVVDARIPKSSFIKDINDFTKNKGKIILMSKYDLCDQNETNKWVKYYESLDYKVIVKKETVKKDLIDAVKVIMKDVNDRRKKNGLLPKKAKVMIVGVSNVGKSTLINKLVNKKATEVGNKPGVTKNINMIKISNEIDLIDTPGILWPKFEDEETALNLASMTIIKEEVLPIDEVAIYILNKLSLLYPNILKNVFGIETFNIENIEEDYLKISKYKSIPLCNKEIDFDRINNYIINSIKNETIKGITFDRIK